MNQFVKTDIDQGLATITFFTEASNSLPGVILKELVDHINAAGTNEAVKLIVLQSGGDRTFCAGASFDELAAINDIQTGKVFFMGFANVINAMRKCPKIIIGRIQGKAVGGGVGLAAACDYTMATTHATVRLSELAVGIGPFVIGPVVERRMGLSAFSQMALNATEWQTAEWAKTHGLYHEVFDTTDFLDDYLKRFTTILLNSNPLALKELKTIFWSNTDHWDTLLESRAAISGELVLSTFTKAAIAKFKAG